jgi:hypothetical protein
MFGSRIRRAADNAAAAGAAGARAANNANYLVTLAAEVFERVEEQGYVELVVDITDNPLLEKYGVDGKINIRIMLPSKS